MNGRGVVLYRATKDGDTLPALVVRAVEAVPQVGGQPIEGAETELLLDLVFVDPAAEQKYTASDSHTKAVLAVRPAADEPGAVGYAEVDAAWISKQKFAMTTAQFAEYEERRKAKMAKAQEQQTGRAAAQVQPSPNAGLAGSAPAPADVAVGLTSSGALAADVCGLPSAADLDAMAAEKLAAEQTSGAGETKAAEAETNTTADETAEAAGQREQEPESAEEIAAS